MHNSEAKALHPCVFKVKAKWNIHTNVSTGRFKQKNNLGERFELDQQQ